MSLARRVLRRAWQTIPPGLRERTLRRVPGTSFRLMTRGLEPSAVALAWAAEHRRPISIVIPSYNDLVVLRPCLASIRATCDAFDYEVIVVDDYCDPSLRAELSGLQDDHVRVIFKDRRDGFAVAVNRGLAEARHDAIVLNSDTVAQPGWVEALQRAAYAIDPRIGMVSPKLVYPDGRIQYGGTYYARVLAPQWFGHLYVGRAATDPIANVPGYNRSVSGACVYVTRATLDAVGGLDEDYWLGFEDVDWGVRAWSEGIRCYYEPSAWLVHHESATRGYSQGWRELASMRHFWRRWGGQFIDRDLGEGPVPLDYVISSAASVYWRRYVEQQATALRERGHVAEVYEVQADVSPDNRIVDALALRNSIKIACDHGAAATVWNATLQAGAPAYLLPGVESDTAGIDEAVVLAGYRPEFEYIAPNRAVAQMVQGRVAWESRARVVPALSVDAPIRPPGDGPLVTIGLSADDRRAVDEIATGLAGVSVEHLEDRGPDALLERIAALKPRALLTLSHHDTSLETLFLMSFGLPVIALADEMTRYEIMDGYNALTVERDDLASIGRAIADLVDHDDVARELGANARTTAERFWRLNVEQMAQAFADIARRAY